jgi:hypothetical protein
VSTAGDQVSVAALKLDEAVARAERAAVRLETGQIVKQEPPKPQPQRIVPVSLVEPIDDNYKPPRLKSRIPGIIMLLVAAGALYFIYHQYTKQEDLDEAAKKSEAEKKAAAEKAQHDAIEDLPDPGAIRVSSNPPQAGVWLKIGRTPVTSIPLTSGQMHEIRIEGVDGYDPIDTQVVAAHWNGDKQHRKAQIVITLKPSAKDPKTGKPTQLKLPVMPPKPPDATGFPPGRGTIEVTSTPSSAEVWMYIGMTNNVELNGIQAGVAYELRVLADGYLPGYISVTADEWRDGGDPSAPINRAKKKAVLEKSVDLVADPNAPKDPKDPKAPKKGK